MFFSLLIETLPLTNSQYTVWHSTLSLSSLSVSSIDTIRDHSFHGGTTTFYSLPFVHAEGSNYINSTELLPEILF